MEHLSQAQLRALFDSKEGRALLELVKQQSGQTLQQAAMAVKSGDYARAQALLTPLLGKDVRKLADQLGANLG